MRTGVRKAEKLCTALQPFAATADSSGMMFTDDLAAGSVNWTLTVLVSVIFMKSAWALLNARKVAQEVEDWRRSQGYAESLELHHARTAGDSRMNGRCR